MSRDVLKQAAAVPLVEQLRSVPANAKLRIDTPNALGCMDTRSIPVGRLCHEAAAALQQQEAGNVDGVKVVPLVRRQECAATGAGHHDGPYGPLRQAQCYYCGEKPSDSSQEKS